MTTAGNSDRERIVPGFWQHAECVVVLYLSAIGVPFDEVRAIGNTLMQRLARIPASIPYGADDGFWCSYSALIIDGCLAAQRVVAAEHGYLSGKLVGDWPPTPIKFEDQFLRAMQDVVSGLEAEANASRRSGLH